MARGKTFTAKKNCMSAITLKIFIREISIFSSNSIKYRTNTYGWYCTQELKLTVARERSGEPRYDLVNVFLEARLLASSFSLQLASILARCFDGAAAATRTPFFCPSTQDH